MSSKIVVSNKISPAGLKINPPLESIKAYNALKIKKEKVFEKLNVYIPKKGITHEVIGGALVNNEKFLNKMERNEAGPLTFKDWKLMVNFNRKHSFKHYTELEDEGILSEDNADFVLDISLSYLHIPMHSVIGQQVIYDNDLYLLFYIETRSQKPYKYIPLEGNGIESGGVIEVDGHKFSKVVYVYKLKPGETFWNNSLFNFENNNAELLTRHCYGSMENVGKMGTKLFDSNGLIYTSLINKQVMVLNEAGGWKFLPYQPFENIVISSYFNNIIGEEKIIEYSNASDKYLSNIYKILWVIALKKIKRMVTLIYFINMDYYMHYICFIAYFTIYYFIFIHLLYYNKFLKEFNALLY